MSTERQFPIQGKETYTGKQVTIPWRFAELAYEEYSARYGTSQSLERLAERHGFGVYEVIELLAARIEKLSSSRSTGRKDNTL